MRVRLSYLAVGLAIAATSAYAQDPAPRANPSIELAGKKVAVEYGQPTLGDRSFDDLMKQLPEDRMWRAGTNQVTTFETAGDLMVGDKKVPAGKYSLYVHCGADEAYSLAFNKVLGQPLGKIWDKAPDALKNEPWPHFKYTEEIGDQEVARVAMKKVDVEEPVDPFTIKLKAKDDMGKMVLMWGDRAWAVGLKPAQ